MREPGDHTTAFAARRSFATKFMSSELPGSTTTLSFEHVRKLKSGLSAPLPSSESDDERSLSPSGGSIFIT
jgi:hypothetical protein